MKNGNKRLFLILIILVGFSSFLKADDKRVIPLDLYLVIDCSESMNRVKSDAFDWVYTKMVDRLLIEGDKVAIWSAGESAQIVHNGEISVSGGKQEIRDLLQNLVTGGKSADFSGALRDLAPRLFRTDQSRLPYTVLVTSAVGLEGALSGGSQELLRWFRSEKYSGWQVLVAAPDIAPKVRQAASNYMSSQR
jgi:Mg-chelatase subunit ChlD